MLADSNEYRTPRCGARKLERQGQTVELRNGDAPGMAELDAVLASSDAKPNAPAKPEQAKPARAKQKDAPAVAMTDKSDAGSDVLVQQLGAEALAGALGEVAKAAAAPHDDSKAIHERRFAIEVDHARDGLLTDRKSVV